MIFNGGKMNHIFCGLVTLVILSACATRISVTHLDEFRWRPANKLPRIYTSKEAVRFPYVELALITVDDQGWEFKESDLIEDIQKKAAEIGAEGVILTEKNANSKIAGIYSGGMYVPVSSTQTTLSAIAIRSEPMGIRGERNADDLPPDDVELDEAESELNKRTKK
jgi:hypothetical protein